MILDKPLTGGTYSEDDDDGLEVTAVDDDDDELTVVDQTYQVPDAAPGTPGVVSGVGSPGPIAGLIGDGWSALKDGAASIGEAAGDVAPDDPASILPIGDDNRNGGGGDGGSSTTTIAIGAVVAIAAIGLAVVVR